MGFKRIGMLVITAFSAYGCFAGPGFFKQSGSASLTNKQPGSVQAQVESDSGGVLTAKLDSSSGNTQVVSASANSAIAGTTVAFPPGAVAISTSVTIQQGDALATSDVGQSLGVDSSANMTAASSAVVISNAAGIDAAVPFTVALNVSGSGLALTGAHYSVVYKVRKASAGGALFLGIIPEASLQIDGGKASFQTQFFGSFQLVTTTVTITPPAQEVATTAPIVTAAQAAASATPTPDTTTAAATPTPTSAPLADPTNITTSVTDASIVVSWNAVTGAASYAVAYRNDGATPTSCADGNKLAVTQGATPSVTATGLTSNHTYAFRVCTVDANGTLSGGAVYSAQTTPPNVTSLAANVIGSHRISLSWVAADATSTYIISYVAGTPSGAMPAAPTDCSGGTPVGNVTTYDVAEFNHLTPVAFRVCSINGGPMSSGATITATTLEWPFTCSSGTPDGTCVISANFNDPGTGSAFLISGNGDLTINASMTITGSPLRRMIIDMKGTVTVNGTVSVKGKGYQGSLTPGYDGVTLGAMHGAGQGGSSPGGGAYGGEGGTNAPNPAYGRAYGAYDLANNFGSSGGNGTSTCSSYDGNGGGSLEIDADTLVINGTLDASGDTGSQCTPGGGGGAGGSILINVRNFQGTGSINASGGAAYGSVGGGGGGGRIAVFFDGSVSGSSMSFLNDGGAGGASCSPTGVCDGAAGTIFKHDTNANMSGLDIKGLSYPSHYSFARTPIDPTLMNLSKVTIQGSTSLVYPRVSFISPMTTPKIVDLVLTNFGTIDNSGMGDAGGASGVSGSGTGGGAGTSTSAYGGGGGAHIGNGGSGTGGASGGSSFEVAASATQAGSGGGGSNGGRGGNGGGLLSIMLSGTLSITNASIVSKGEPSPNSSNCGGGGGGGLIEISAAALNITGTGTFSADGGSGSCGGISGGGGGGGGIHINIPSITGTPTCTENGGTGYTSGTSGGANC